MKAITIISALGVAALVGGVGLHYAVDQGSHVVLRESIQPQTTAAAVDTFTPPANVVHCGEAALLKNGKLSNQEAFDCFQQHLLNCSPADFIAVRDNGNIKYSRTIIEAKGPQCMVREAYIAIAKTDLVGKGMTCAYNPLLPLSQEINYRSCVGILRDELFNQLPQ